MRVERIEHYKKRLGATASRFWGQILLELAAEAMGSERTEADQDATSLRKELEVLKMKYAILRQGIEPYADTATYTGNQSVQQLTLAATVALSKADKVDWLLTNAGRSLSAGPGR